MSPGRDPRQPLHRRALNIGSAIMLMVAVILVVGRIVAGLDREPEYPSPGPLAPPLDPIPAEADVFRLKPDDLAVDPARNARPGAPRRTLAIHRGLRAFPGAPPRITHGLTGEELRNPNCNACHARGGYSPRFGTYVPVTPHPEFGDCLQCHVPDGELVGIGFPDPTRDGICYQCHTLDDRTVTFAPLDWPEPDWPEIGQRAMEGSPPWIPHHLYLRGNCLACHAGPGAVVEIRTDHPERATCRQCHVPGPPGDTDVFSRFTDGPGDPGDADP